LRGFRMKKLLIAAGILAMSAGMGSAAAGVNYRF
jgi:hypothetical protein